MGVIQLPQLPCPQEQTQPLNTSLLQHYTMDHSWCVDVPMLCPMPDFQSRSPGALEL